MTKCQVFNKTKLNGNSFFNTIRRRDLPESKRRLFGDSDEVEGFILDTSTVLAAVLSGVLEMQECFSA